jgi:selenocysteine lyase/cysteine desulfurase
MTGDLLPHGFQDSNWDVAPGYLNTALRGVPPRQSVMAATALIQDWGRATLDWRQWLDEAETVRSAWARLAGVDPRAVGIGHTSASLMAAVARALPSGASVITLQNEHNSCTIPFLYASHGLIVESVAPDQLMDRLARGGFAAVAISLVQSLDGSIANLADMRPHVTAAGAWLCVDATQAFGWLPFDCAVADLVVAASYKWMMGPNGPAFAWASPALLAQLQPASPNWFACADPHAAPYGAGFALAEDARKLDVVPGLVSMAALRPSLALLEHLGIATISAHNLALARHVRAGLGLPETGSAIVSARNSAAADALARAGLVFTRRAGRIRLAFHIHNRLADADHVLNALDGLSMEP